MIMSSFSVTLTIATYACVISLVDVVVVFQYCKFMRNHPDPMTLKGNGQEKPDAAHKASGKSSLLTAPKFKKSLGEPS